MIKAEKKKLVKKLAEEFSRVDNYYFTDFSGIDAQEVTRLRTELRENNAGMKVVKNRLLARVLSDLGLKLPAGDVLVGPTAVLYSHQEILVPARKVKEFADEDVPIRFKGAFLEGRFYGAEEVERLASIPSREELLSQLAGLFQGAKSALVGVLQAKLSELTSALSSLRAKKEEE